MAVKLRLKRMGSKQRPFYRIVAADSRNFRDGKDIEVIGTYNPITNPAEVKVNEELAMKWLRNGAIPTDTVRNLFRQTGINQKFHTEKMNSKKGTKLEKNTPTKAETKKTATKKTTKEEK